MSVKSRLKEFYKNWLEPPGVRRWRTAVPNPDVQKFWLGTPVPAPPKEQAYFESAGLSPATITRRDDSRACGELTGAVALPLPTLASGDMVQLAVTADQWRPDSTISFSVGGQTTRHVALKPQRWLDVRLSPPPGASSVRVETDQAVWISHPRVVRKRENASSPRPRHILVIVMDGLGRRVLSDRHPTEPDRITMPNLERFLAGGFTAPVGFSSSDWTLPTTASFFNGIYASRHGMVHPSLPMQHDANRKLLAEYFQEAGYHTLALSTGNRLTPAFGSHRGFDRFIYHWPYEGRTVFDYDPTVWSNEILGHIDLHRADSTFTYVHFPDSHPAWNLPPFTRAFNLGRRGDSTGHDLDRLERSPLGRTQGLQLLHLRLHELDRALSGLLRYLEEALSNEFLVVFTADHGTPWPDFADTEPTGRPSLNEFRIATFLRMKGVGVPNAVSQQVVSPNLDLLPTLLALAGLSAPPDLDGRALLAAGPERKFAVSESVYRQVYEVAVSDGERQWIEKYPLDERTNRLTGPAYYGAQFRAGCMDYGVPSAASDPEYQAVIQDHISRVGIRNVMPGVSAGAS